MKERRPSEIVLKALLSNVAPEKRARLQKFLSADTQKRLDQIPSFHIEYQESEKGISLEQIHWSWLIPTLKTYSAKDQKLFLSALSPHVSENLSEELHLSSTPKEELRHIGASFLRQILLSHLIGHKSKIVPPDYLPDSPLKPLLKLTKKKLTRLIDFLSLYDLAAEIRQIVETKILKKIYSLLSEEEKKFLKIAMTHKEPYPVPRLKLEKWDGSEESLHLLLHKRGLARLGAALSLQIQDLAWYVCHQLDIGRGNTLLKLCAQEAPSDLGAAMTKQIEELLSNKDLKL
jgi:hypothetical protein